MFNIAKGCFSIYQNILIIIEGNYIQIVIITALKVINEIKVYFVLLFLYIAPLKFLMGKCNKNVVTHLLFREGPLVDRVLLNPEVTTCTGPT